MRNAEPGAVAPPSGAGRTSAADASAASLRRRMRPSLRYKDLPYMGEMRLEHARPRRGRKPKKADIRQLIYKNYGTTVEEEPLNLCVRDLRLENAVAEALSGGGGRRCRDDDGLSIRRITRGGRAAPAKRRDPVTAASSTDATSCEAGARLSGRSDGLRDGEPRSAPRKPATLSKVEKRFEEGGFLIQTQRLESAEGCTYCKFRQLRKFTRYLFRSWRHHLPADVAGAADGPT